MTLAITDANHCCCSGERSNTLGCQRLTKSLFTKRHAKTVAVMRP